MGRFIIKLTPEEDRYVIWSTGVDAPVFDGTWAEIEEYEVAYVVRDLLSRMAEERKDADENGTTVRFKYRGDDPLRGSWEDEELSVVNCPFDDAPADWKPGSIKRSDIGKWLDTEDNSLITPRADDL